MMNPMQVAQNRTARLVREAHTPAYTSETGKPNLAKLAQIEELACSDDWCHICSRPTDHFGEHDPEQLLAWAARPGMLQRLLK